MVTRLGFLAVHTRRWYFVSGSSNLFKDSTTTIAAPGRWSFGERARRLPDYHRQGPAGSGMGAAAAARSGGGIGRSVIHGPRCNFSYV